MRISKNSHFHFLNDYEVLKFTNKNSIISAKALFTTSISQIEFKDDEWRGPPEQIHMKILTGIDTIHMEFVQCSVARYVAPFQFIRLYVVISRTWLQHVCAFWIT